MIRDVTTNEANTGIIVFRILPQPSLTCSRRSSTKITKLWLQISRTTLKSGVLFSISCSITQKNRLNIHAYELGITSIISHNSAIM